MKRFPKSKVIKIIDKHLNKWNDVNSDEVKFVKKFFIGYARFVYEKRLKEKNN